ncbi:MAG: pimeloyl-ACP methyl ester carboxylesterase [Verrucomicrobiales bacterium]|jgi:pimeloyl-ACP methyl ester carboxylesterase
MKNWKRRLIILLSALVVAYLGACGYLWATQTQQIFDPCKEIHTDPGRMGMEYIDVRVPVTSDGEQIMLDGIWIPAETAESTNNAPSIIFLHGQDDTIGKNLEHNVRQLHALGYNVLQIDYRGYGNSFDSYTPSEKTVYEDAEAAWQFLIVDLGADPNLTFIYGHSLGGAIAIELAMHHPEAAGLIVESTFTSIIDMVKYRQPILTRLLPMKMLIRHQFDSKNKIGNLQLPVLLIHGRADAKVPYMMSQQLYELAPEPKDRLIIKGGEHANSASIDAVDYKAKVATFVGKHLTKTGADD